MNRFTRFLASAAAAAMLYAGGCVSKIDVPSEKETFKALDDGKIGYANMPEGSFLEAFVRDEHYIITDGVHPFDPSLRFDQDGEPDFCGVLKIVDGKPKAAELSEPAKRCGELYDALSSRSVDYLVQGFGRALKSGGSVRFMDRGDAAGVFVEGANGLKYLASRSNVTGKDVYTLMMVDPSGLGTPSIIVQGDDGNYKGISSLVERLIGAARENQGW